MKNLDYKRSYLVERIKERNLPEKYVNFFHRSLMNFNHHLVDDDKMDKLIDFIERSNVTCSGLKNMKEVDRKLIDFVMKVIYTVGYSDKLLSILLYKDEIYLKLLSNNIDIIKDMNLTNDEMHKFIYIFNNKQRLDEFLDATSKGLDLNLLKSIILDSKFTKRIYSLNDLMKLQGSGLVAGDIESNEYIKILDKSFSYEAINQFCQLLIEDIDEFNGFVKKFNKPSMLINMFMNCREYLNLNLNQFSDMLERYHKKFFSKEDFYSDKMTIIDKALESKFKLNKLDEITENEFKFFEILRYDSSVIFKTYEELDAIIDDLVIDILIEYGKKTDGPYSIACTDIAWVINRIRNNEIDEELYRKSIVNRRMLSYNYLLRSLYDMYDINEVMKIVIDGEEEGLDPYLLKDKIRREARKEK